MGGRDIFRSFDMYYQIASQNSSTGPLVYQGCMSGPLPKHSSVYLNKQPFKSLSLTSFLLLSSHPVMSLASLCSLSTTLVFSESQARG